MMEIVEKKHECKKTIMAVHDAMDVLSGKWKISIVASLMFNEKRYSEILKDVHGISGKMLSRELKELEMNQLIERTVITSQPIIVQYALTEYGETLKPVIGMLADWGLEHRRTIFGV